MGAPSLDLQEGSSSRISSPGPIPDALLDSFSWSPRCDSASCPTPQCKDTLADKRQSRGREAKGAPLDPHFRDLVPLKGQVRELGGDRWLPARGRLAVLCGNSNTGIDFCDSLSHTLDTHSGNGAEYSVKGEKACRQPSGSSPPWGRGCVIEEAAPPAREELVVPQLGVQVSLSQTAAPKL